MPCRLVYLVLALVTSASLIVVFSGTIVFTFAGSKLYDYEIVRKLGDHERTRG